MNSSIKKRRFFFFLFKRPIGPEKSKTLVIIVGRNHRRRRRKSETLNHAAESEIQNSTGWRSISIGSRRTFSSSSGSKGEMSLYEAMKSGLVPSFKPFNFTRWAMYGYMASGSYELYKFMKAYRRWEKGYRKWEELAHVHVVKRG